MNTMAAGFPTPQFGINLHTRMRPDGDLVAEALHAEQLGFDLVTLHGHVLHTTAPSYETWTLLSWVAARTARIRLAPIVLALPNRHPAMLMEGALPNFFTINGKAYPATDTIQMRLGQKLLLRFIGSNNNFVHWMHIHVGRSRSSRAMGRRSSHQRAIWLIR
jgi:hypothetical protein